MIITSIIASGNRHKYNGCMATLANDNKNRPGYLLTISWYANPRNNIWRNAPEADPDLRNELVQKMIQASKH
jgi:hypothetical protein